ncbi:MAG TPA: FecR family protein [Dongiaceae bacterium]
MISRRNMMLRTAVHAALFGGAAAFGLIKLAFAAEKVGSANDVVNQAWGTPPDAGRIELAATSPVHRNELLETGQESAVEVIFADDSRLTMGQSARVTVDEFVFADPANSRSVINLTKGAFRFVSGKMAEEKVTLKTPTATMVIRGTELKIDVADDGQTEVSVIEGAIR